MKRLAFVALLALGSCGDDDGGMPEDTEAPTIVSRTPAPDAENVYVNDPITIVFSEPIASEPSITIAGAQTTRSWSADRTTVTLTLSERPPAPFTATIMVSQASDAAFNTLPDTSWSWTVPQWQQPGDSFVVNPAMAASGQELAVDSSGNPLMVWQEGGAIYASRLTGSAFEPLGEALSATGQAFTPAVAFDGQDRPVVAWLDGEATPAPIRASRWDGSAWASLPSPGVGTGLGMARDLDGTVYLVTQDALATVGEVALYRLSAGDTWESLGGPFSVDGQGSPDGPAGVVVAVANGTAYVAWVVDTGGGKELRTARKAGAGLWEVLPDANRPGGQTARYPHITVDTGGRPVLAWEEWGGASIDSRVAVLDQDTWEQLGRVLDVDPHADGRWPSVAVGADGTVYASWVEFGTNARKRLWVARQDAGRWRIVGGQALNREPGSFAAETRIAVHNGWPIVAWQEWQANDWMMSKVWVRRYNGNDQALPGLETRPSTAGCQFSALGTTMLSQTGCFTSLGREPVADAGLIPFDINSQLWSDGALKRRWLVLPDGTTIDRTDTGAWVMPVGTMIVKEFALVMDEEDAASRSVVETRFLIKLDAEDNWEGFSFQWDDAFTDAVLLAGTPETKDWTIATAGGGTRVHTHTYPGRGQCTTCHNRAAGIVLGLQSKQLDRHADYGGVADHQLEALDRIGMFSAPLAGLPVDPFPTPGDVGHSLEARSRSYMASNCGHCHRPGGPRETRDLRWETPLASTMLCADNEIIPGDSASSIVFQRMNTRPTGGMPPLATLLVDSFALNLVGTWIDSMTSCP